MKKVYKVLVALVIVLSPTVRVDAASLSDEQVALVRANCIDAQISIQRLQQTEKPTRINRGHLYEIFGRLLVDFNTRAAANKIDAPILMTLTGNLRDEIAAFAENYTKYDDMIRSLVTRDCQAEPIVFHDALGEARVQRAKLNTSVVKIDQILDDYQKVVNDIKKQVAEGNQ